MNRANLLGEIESQSGVELLQSSRFYTTPPGRTYLPQLDTILLDQHPRSTELSSLNRGDVVELQGPSSSGKTQVILYWTLIAILPAKWTCELSQEASSRPPRQETISIGGREQSVVLIDADGRFPLLTLQHYVMAHFEHRIEDHTIKVAQLFGSRPSPAAYEAAVISCMRRLHVFRPTSGLSLAATLKSLPRYLEQRAPDIELAYVMIDSLSAFHHQDVYRHQMATLSSSVHPMRITLSALAYIRKRFCPVIVLSNWGLGWADAGAGLYRQHLMPPYPASFVADAPLEKPFDVLEPLAAPHAGPLPINVHITLHQPALAPYATGTSFEDMLSGNLPRDRLARDGAVVIGTVRLPIITEGAEVAGKFSFKIGPDGIDVS